MNIESFSPSREGTQITPAVIAPNSEVLKDAAQEVAAIRSRHDGVHCIHGIYCAMMAYQQFAADGRWNDKLQEGFDTQLVRARIIDKTGFDAGALTHICGSISVPTVSSSV